MASSGADHIPGGSAMEVEASETTIEIKIKTLDSQTYTLRVDKQMPVPALKEQIASVTGVVSEQQRLICRGKVLKDDQLLSAYHVEDGHTLHLVVRQPIPPSSEASPNHPGNDPASTSRHTHQIAPGIVIETFSLPAQGDGAPPPEISRILSAVLGSIGLSGLGTGIDGTDNRERASGNGNILDAINGQAEQTGLRASSDRLNSTFGQSAGFSLGSLQPPVIPDSLTTLNQYLTNIQREFDALGREGGSSGQAGTSQPTATAPAPAALRQGFPTPASLAEVAASARQLLTNQAAGALLQLERQLENQESVTDASARLNTQADAMTTGALIHNLGSFLLELGRTIMTLRMGQSPSEAVVNAGPAVFISPNGPNPIMVQALPFQVGTSFGSIPMGAVQTGPGVTSGLATGYMPRRIDIQIRRGSPLAAAAATATAAANANREEQGNTQQPPGQRSAPTNSGGENPSNQGASRTVDGTGLAGESGVRVVPLRTMVATIPGSFGRLSSDSSGNSVGLYHPVLGRFQHVAAGERGAQASREHHPPVQHSLESQQRPLGDPARDGPSQTPNTRQQEPAIGARNVSINIVSAEGIQQTDPDRQISGSVLQFVRNLFPGGEINLEDGGSEEAGAGSAGPDQSRASGGTEVEHEAEPIATDEGIFLSNLLRQIMPLLPGQGGLESDANASEPGMALDPSTKAESSSASASRRPDDGESGSPDSKRQKTE